MLDLHCYIYSLYAQRIVDRQKSHSFHASKSRNVNSWGLRIEFRPCDLFIYFFRFLFRKSLSFSIEIKGSTTIISVWYIIEFSVWLRSSSTGWTNVSIKFEAQIKVLIVESWIQHFSLLHLDNGNCLCCLFHNGFETFFSALHWN